MYGIISLTGTDSDSSIEEVVKWLYTRKLGTMTGGAVTSYGDVANVELPWILAEQEELLTKELPKWARNNGFRFKLLSGVRKTFKVGRHSILQVVNEEMRVFQLLKK